MTQTTETAVMTPAEYRAAIDEQKRALIADCKAKRKLMRQQIEWLKNLELRIARDQDTNGMAMMQFEDDFVSITDMRAYHTMTK